MLEAAGRGGVCGSARAPDTFLGGGLQTARALIDDGAIGDAARGERRRSCSLGPERWHRPPGSFYGPGAGPVLDVGPYYVTALVHLLGPVQAVVAAAGRGVGSERLIGAGPQSPGATVVGRGADERRSRR